jgi:carboxyl-terminal processing protease
MNAGRCRGYATRAPALTPTGVSMVNRSIRVSTLVGLAFVSGCLLDGPTRGLSDPPRDFLRSFVDILQEYSVLRDSIDWPVLRTAVMDAGAAATTIEETEPALALGLEILSDDHSWIRLPDGSYLPYTPSFTCTGPTVTTPTDIPADIGYVRVGAFSGGVAEAGAYTSVIQTAMADQDDPGLTGWIVDLRGNGGGNMWPMLAALWPFLQATVGYFVDPDDAWIEWYVSGPYAYLGTTLVGEATNPYAPNLGSGRVAVLTDKRVASSGEATAVAFRGRPDTRTFGGETCGVPTGISAGPIGHGYTLGLAVVWMTDRDSTVYSAPLQPDEVIADPAAALARAIEWLRTGM